MLGKLDLFQTSNGTKQVRLFFSEDEDRGLFIEKLTSGYVTPRLFTNNQINNFSIPPKKQKSLSNSLITSLYWSEWWATNDIPYFVRVYQDGFKIHSGYLVKNTSGTVTFSVPYIHTPVVLFGNMSARDGMSYDSELYPQNVTATTFRYKNITPHEGQGCRWISLGY